MLYFDADVAAVFGAALAFGFIFGGPDDLLIRVKGLFYNDFSLRDEIDIDPNPRIARAHTCCQDILDLLTQNGLRYRLWLIGSWPGRYRRCLRRGWFHRWAEEDS